MRRLLLITLALCVAGAALAATAPTSNQLSTVGKGTFPGDGATTPRVGGEDIPGAALIPGLPFSDTGATCGYVNNYDEVCPYTGSASPDVVYKYTPTAAEAITVDLCASSYDTKVYIYAGGVGNLVACNDDAGCGYSGWQSQLTNVALTAGVTYYIVVDGYGSACGTYDFQVIGYAPCEVICPAGGVPEGEPPCGPDYYDNWNGGCNSIPNVFQAIYATAGGCLDLCGKSGTYTYTGLSYRDTAWFDITGIGATVTATCTAEFPMQFIYIYGPDCNNLLYNLLTGSECQPVTLSYYAGAGVHHWLWVGAQVFTGIPCDADYLLNVCGILGGPTPVEQKSWGGIKATYK